MLICTIRPLVASSGSVKEPGVVRRFLALVSWSITASISYSANRKIKVTIIHVNLCVDCLLPPFEQVFDALSSTDLINFSSCFEAVALITAVQQLQSLIHVIPGILDLMENKREVKLCKANEPGFENNKK